MMEIQVENIKCGGCANSIRSGLEKLPGVSNVEIDIENGIVRLTADNNQRDEIVAKLTSMGYPETGSVEGLKAAKAKATSFVSCAVGRMSK